jgi:hypothetical protein
MVTKPSFEEFLKVVYQYYPRGPGNPDHEFEGFEQTEEYRRLVAARIRAGTENGPWRAMLDRLEARFPGMVEDRAFHLPAGTFDGAYTGKLVLPTLAPEVADHELVFMVSFLVPYYVIYRQCWLYVDWVEPPPDEYIKETRRDPGRPTLFGDGFEFTEEEEPYARAIAAEIEATYGHAPMPPALGKMIVPDAWLDAGSCGTEPLFHYLFANIVPR